jgi:hypothetical protein
MFKKHTVDEFADRLLVGVAVGDEGLNDWFQLATVSETKVPHYPLLSISVVALVNLMKTPLLIWRRRRS